MAAQVLSVVAQQVLEIQLAVKAKLKTFVFEGSELTLRPSCNTFITMVSQAQPDSALALPCTIVKARPSTSTSGNSTVLQKNQVLQHGRTACAC